jgi:two-component system nitrate/nitrite response regulator NarL
MMTDRTISILLATDAPILRDAMRTIIGNTPDLKFIGCIEAHEEIVAAARKSSPRLVILDASLEPGSLLKIIDGIVQGDSKVLLIGGEEDDDSLLQALFGGASGIIGRKATPDLICRSIRAVVAGELWVTRQMTSRFIDLLRSGSPQPASVTRTAARILNRGRAQNEQPPSGENYGLTKRELQIVGALVEGQTNKDIAATFGVSEYTVKHHLTNIFDKLGVYNRVELVLFAITKGLGGSSAEETSPSSRSGTRKR